MGEVIAGADNGAEDKDIVTLDEGQKDNGADQGAEGADKSGADNADKGDKADKTKIVEANPKIADEEPKSRKRNIDFIIQRKNDKIAKLEKENNGANEDEDEGDDIDDDDAKIIDKRVAKAMTPFIQKQMLEEDEGEISSFVKDNPDFAPYADKVRKFAQHPTRREMPIKSIFYEVAGDDLLKIGAAREKKATDKAKESSAGGGDGTGGESEKGVWDLTPAEFAAQQEKLRQRPRD